MSTLFRRAVERARRDAERDEIARRIRAAIARSGPLRLRSRASSARAHLD